MTNLGAKEEFVNFYDSLTCVYAAKKPSGFSNKLHEADGEFEVSKLNIFSNCMLLFFEDKKSKPKFFLKNQLCSQSETKMSKNEADAVI